MLVDSFVIHVHMIMIERATTANDPMSESAVNTREDISQSGGWQYAAPQRNAKESVHSAKGVQGQYAIYQLFL